MSEDLQRFLAGQKPLARPRRWWHHLWKWSKRRPRLAAALAFAILLVLASVGGGILYKNYVTADYERRLEIAWNARRVGLLACGNGDLGAGMLQFADALAIAPENATDLQQLLRLDLGAWQYRIPSLIATLPHPDKVISVRYSPGGSLVLTLCYDHQARLWATDTGSLINRPLAHPAMLLEACFSRDGRNVRTICSDGYFRTWCTGTGALLREERARCLEGVPPGDHRDRFADLLWELEVNETPPRGFPDSRCIVKFRLSPDRQRVATVSAYDRVQLWQTSHTKPVLASLQSPGKWRDAAFGADGKLLLTAGDDRFIHFWNSSFDTVSRPALQHPGSIHAVAVDPSGAFVASGDNDTLRLWDARTQQLVVALPQQSLVQIVAFSGDGKQLASANGENHVRLWMIPTRLPNPLIHPHLKPRGPEHLERGKETDKGFDGIMHVAYHPKGRQLYTSGIDGAVYVWDLATGVTGKPLLQHTEVVTRVVVSPTGDVILTGSRDKTGRLWDCGKGEPLGPELAHERWVGAVALSPNRQTIATGCLGDGPVRLWKARTGECLAEFGPVSGVFDVTFSPNGKLVLAGSLNQAYVWDLATGVGHELAHNSPVLAAAFHPSGRCFVTGSLDGQLCWWNTNTLERQAVLPAHTGCLRHAVFAPGGRTLATAGWDGKVAFWDSETKQQLGPIAVLPAAVQTLAFHPDGKTLAVGCKNGEVHFLRPPHVLQGSPRQLKLWVQGLIGLELGPGNLPRGLDEATRKQRLYELVAEGGPPT